METFFSLSLTPFSPPASQSISHISSLALRHTHTHLRLPHRGTRREKVGKLCDVSWACGKAKKGWKNFPFTIFKYERFYARMVSGPTLTRITKHLIIFLRIKTIQIMYGMYLRPCWHLQGSNIQTRFLWNPFEMTDRYRHSRRIWARVWGRRRWGHIMPQNACHTLPPLALHIPSSNECEARVPLGIQIRTWGEKRVWAGEVCRIGERKYELLGARLTFFSLKTKNAHDAMQKNNHNNSLLFTFQTASAWLAATLTTTTSTTVNSRGASPPRPQWRDTAEATGRGWSGGGGQTASPQRSTLSKKVNTD